MNSRHTHLPLNHTSAMTTTTESPVISRRYDFVLLFDVKDGNPNGDPDFANTPRFDQETRQGLVSDVALKRKIRDYVFTAKTASGAPEAGFDIFVLQGHSLESRQQMPFLVEGGIGKEKAKANDTKRADVDAARRWMCEHFFDIRAFGAVMSTTNFNCGQVRGPVQITFARSIDPISSTEHGITRVAYTKEEKKQGTSAQTEMGNKHTVAYGLYRAHGFVSPHLASGPNGTGFTEEDLTLLWNALENMFDLDRSAARGLMATRRLIIFEHASALGNAPAHKLFDAVHVERAGGADAAAAPRAFSDYNITINRAAIPAGVTVHERA